MKLTFNQKYVFLVKATEVIMKKLKKAILFKRPKLFIYFYLFIINLYYLFIYLFLETFKWHMD